MSQRVHRRTVRGATLAMLTLLGASAVAWASPWADGHLLIVAHRGDVERWPANTREAIRAAADLHVHGIEFDVQRSSSGTWHVFHDDEMNRILQTTGRLGQLTDGQIASLPIVGGPGYREAEHGDNFRVPTLESVLAELHSFPGFIIVDVKDWSDAAHEEVVHLLSAHGFSDRAALICRTEAGAAAVKRIDPGIPTLARTYVTDQPQHAPAIDLWLADARVELRSPLDVWTRPAVAAFANSEEATGEFAVDERPFAERAARWGVRFFITDYVSEALDSSFAAPDDASFADVLQP